MVDESADSVRNIGKPRNIFEGSPKAVSTLGYKLDLGPSDSATGLGLKDIKMIKDLLNKIHDTDVGASQYSSDNEYLSN